MNKNFLIIFICLLAFHQYKCCSQKISGYVTSQDKVLKGVSTVVKKRNKIIEFAFSDNEGRFKFNNVYPDSIEIHISHLNYKKQILVFLPKKDTLIVVELFKSDIILGEVVIKKETPIQYKKDTIV